MPPKNPTIKQAVIQKKQTIAKKMPQLSQPDQYNRAMMKAQKNGGSNGIGVGM